MDNWIDDLPICKHSGVGFQTNQKYRVGGGRRDLHEREDRSFHVKFPSSDVSLYGVFDGHESASVAHFASQKIPAELLLDVEIADAPEPVVNVALKNAFESVEKQYLELINEILVKRTNLQLQTPEGMNSYEIYQRYPSLVNRLQELDKEIQGGASATIALLQGENLYIANVGDSRALLCTKDHDGSLHVEQLSIDHNTSNAEELQRLANLGLDIEKIQKAGSIDQQETTRSFGDFRVKGGYRDVESLRSAASEPVIAEPYISGAIKTDASFHFLAIFSGGFYKTLQEINGSSQVNKDVIALIAAELNDQSTVAAVAQSVVDKLCRAHQEEFARSNGYLCQEREDMTILIRLFSANLGRKSTPVTPPIPVSVKNVPRTSSKPPNPMPVSVPFVLESKSQAILNSLPRLIMPNVRLQRGLSGSLSQPTSQVSSPITVPKQSLTPQCTLRRDLSYVSECSWESNASNTPATASIATITSPLDSSSSSPCASPFSTTIRAASNPQMPCEITCKDPPSADGLLKFSNQTLSLDTSVDDSDSDHDSANEETSAETVAAADDASDDDVAPDGKVHPYIDFSGFIARINQHGGESVVFAEFLGGAGP